MHESGSNPARRTGIGVALFVVTGLLLGVFLAALAGV